jgi:hypothetical protein
MRNQAHRPSPIRAVQQLIVETLVFIGMLLHWPRPMRAGLRLVIETMFFIGMLLLIIYGLPIVGLVMER